MLANNIFLKLITKTPLITLTTDWGQHDYYLGMLKGSILSEIPDAQIVDLSHSIPNFNTHNAAFVVKNSFKSFPIGTIHLVLINTEDNNAARLIICHHEGHYFVTPDNGILGLLFANLPDDIYAVPFDKKDGTFNSLSAFIKAIEQIVNPNEQAMAEARITDYSKKVSFKATIEESTITGSIIYIDSYRNVITNISKSLFDRIGQNRKYNIFIQSKHNKISTLSTRYNQVAPGELLAIFNSANLLEIAIRNGYAAELLSLNIGGNVRVNFM